MSDKDRAKKDHERTDKKNKALRDHGNPRTQRALSVNLLGDWLRDALNPRLR